MTVEEANEIERRRSVQASKDAGVDDGGPAFPVEYTEIHPGMSVRMWLAGQALSGIYAGWPPNVADFDHPVAAENALEAADALLAKAKRAT